jgi:glyoxylase-like metal-dependent hydrolase (beta-lactamase superfamily II)
VYSVTILNNGEWATYGTVMYNSAYSSPDYFKIAQNFFLLEGEGKKILVDTGIDDLLDYTTPAQREQFGLTATKSTSQVLAEHGVDPSDIDILIITHLHFDHYLNARLFDRARIVINRNEYLHVLNPDNKPLLPRSSYPREVLAWLVDEAWDRVDLVEGEVEVLPGLKVVWTGGHTPGHQIVTAQTDEGLVIIPGDEVYLYDHVESLKPIGNHYDLMRHVDTLRYIRDLGGIVLPAHDPLVSQRHPTMRIGGKA